MFGNRDIPVYLFTGFLESGKSTCFQEILEEGNFEDGLRTLYLMTEEGEKEVDEMLLRHNKVDTVLIEDEEDLTEDKCKELVKQYKPARIVIEVNGMWDLVKLINETIPENWIVVQTFTTVNAETFSVYINNMKSLIMSHFQQSDLVILTVVHPIWTRHPCVEMSKQSTAVPRFYLNQRMARLRVILKRNYRLMSPQKKLY